MFSILVAEDDPSLRSLFCTVLTKGGYRCFEAGDGLEACDILDKQHIDMAITDIMMPRLNGFDLVEYLRRRDIHTPVLMVTALDSFEDLQKGFRAGTDDYMVKPVNVNELVIRVGALLRRAQVFRTKSIQFGDMLLHYDELSVTVGDDTLTLPQKEFYLLYKLLATPNKVFTKQQIMDDIWGMDSESTTHTLDVHISRLRERFKDNGQFEIVTIRGLGFKAVKHHGK